MRRKRMLKRIMELEEIGDAVLEKVTALSRQQCLKIYETLERLDWADALGDKPAEWDKMNAGERNIVLSPAIRFIEQRISYKERMRWKRMCAFGETQEQFDAWWESQFMERLSILGRRFI